MKTGTKSVLYGAHCFFIHPFFVALAWWKIFGFPWDLRLWVAFFVHDLGYVGKSEMDSEEGELHPYFGAWVMSLFDYWTAPQEWEHFDFQHGQHGNPCRVGKAKFNEYRRSGWNLFCMFNSLTVLERPVPYWHDFTLHHSRFLAKRNDRPFSKLCVADKLAVALEPWWLYLPRVIATGEIREYMDLHNDPASKYGNECGGNPTTSRREWCVRMQGFCRRWAMDRMSEHAEA